MFAIGLQQIDRTHVGAEPLADQSDDVVKRFGRPAIGRQYLADLLERYQERAFGGGQCLLP